MYYCIGDYRFVYIKMKMDLIYLNVIFKYNVCKRFFKKIYFYFLENYFELVLKLQVKKYQFGKSRKKKEMILNILCKFYEIGLNLQ